MVYSYDRALIGDAQTDVLVASKPMNPTEQAERDFDAQIGLRALAGELLAIADEASDYGPDDIGDGIDVRLRYHDGAYDVLVGDAQYDTDHRGHFGSATVSAGLTADEALDIAADLRDQIIDSVAETV